MSDAEGDIDDANESTGAEEEDTSSDGIVQPYDANKLRVSKWAPTLDLVLKRMQRGEIDLAPDFQRKAGIWKDLAQSRLIESILIRIPLPAFYMDAVNEDLLAVIDGIQRLTALDRFVNRGELRLTGLEFLVDLEGKSFSELPRSLQRRIEETQVDVNIIERGTPVEAKLNLFKRINTSGLSLTAQEIRHAINPGPARACLKELAECTEFKTATDGAMDSDRMEDRECVLRFVAFILTPPEKYSASYFDAFLNQAMQAINRMNAEQRAELANRFRRAMARASQVLGNKAFRKVSWTGRRGRINKALFEAWSIGLDACSDEEIAVLTRRSAALIGEFVNASNAVESFNKAISQGTGDRNKVKLRFKTIRDIIQRTLA
ncbi:MAG TPA: DUF262 domain-containing protein [Candidatus Sumerlaeota bacterium]|nr:DUF262 domain-containing protein [Candidatus Sumerlaeota bacterium]